MKSVLVLGAGKVGKSVAELFLICGKGEYRVTIADRDDASLREAEGNLSKLKGLVKFPIEFASKKLDVTDMSAVKAALKGHDYVVCMLPFNFVMGIAAAADELGVHYFDVTEDVETTEKVREIARTGRGKIALVPQCGLAPGYIAIAAYDIAKQFSQVHELTLRVGALPQFPTNRLKYNVTWSTAGVVNEYCEPCNVMLDGQMVKVPALEGLEHFSFEGIEYEAAYTSGGVGTLIETLVAERKTTAESKVAYKTIRYPGHFELMKFLLQDLRLGVEHADATKGGVKFDRAMAVAMLDNAVPRTLQDEVVVFINGVGIDAAGVRRQINFKRIVHATEMFGRIWPAIELTTAAGVCGMVDLHRQGKLRQSGFVNQEECSLEMFNKTIFGLGYENPQTIEKTVRG